MTATSGPETPSISPSAGPIDPRPPATFRELVFSDLARNRAIARPGWRHVLANCLVNPGMLASVILRSQQALHARGHRLLALLMRSLGSLLVGADFNPGVTIGPGLWLAHPQGLSIGFDLVIGANVTFAGGVTAAADLRADRTRRYATIGDGVTVGAHAVIVGAVTIGRNAMIGANSVVVKDVPDNAVVMGNPARKIGERNPNNLF